MKNSHLSRKRNQYKKAFFFSVFVITALALMLLIFRTNIEFKEEKKAEIFKIRAAKETEFINDIEKDIERALYVYSVRAFNGAYDFIKYNADNSVSEPYIADPNLTIHYLILNGTVDGTPTGYRPSSTQSSDLISWTESIESLGKNLNLNIEFNSPSVTIEQISPWEILVKFNANFSAKEFDNSITWNFMLEKNATINISRERLPDPMYYVESKRNCQEPICTPLTNTIKQRIYEDLWSGDPDGPDWGSPSNPDVTNLKEYVSQQRYSKDPDAPSYLMRLKGNLHCGGNPDQICNNFGIESFVNVTDPNIGDIWRYSSPQNSRECAVDHIFFTSEDCQGQGTQKKIMNMDDKFVLNEQHVVMYGLNMIKIEPS